VDRVIDQFPADRQAQIRIMLSESLKGVISQTLCRKIGGGRAAALEVLIVTSAVSNLIRESKTFQIQSMMQVGKAVGMVTLNDALMDLVTKKLVAPEEAYAKAIDKSGIEAQLKRLGFDPSKPASGGAPGAAPGAPARPAQPAAAAPARS
jgi:twitching motility protein PilT